MKSDFNIDKNFHFSWASFENNLAMEFDGINQSCNYNDPMASIFGTGKFTINIWPKWDDTIQSTLIERVTPNNNFRIFIITSVTSQMLVRLFDSTGAQAVYTWNATALVRNVYSLLSIVFDVTESVLGDRVKVMINGALEPLDVISGSNNGTIRNNGTVLRMNTSGAGKGIVDEHSIFSSVHTIAQHIETYNSGLPFDMTNHSDAVNLEHWYRFGDQGDVDPTIIDQVGSVNMTMINTPTFTTDIPTPTP